MFKTMKILAVTLFLMGTTSAHACGVGEMTPQGYENAPIDHAYNHWKQGDKSAIPFAFLDVRTVEEYKDGHVPGAINIPIGELASRLSEVPKNKRVYVYCESGVRATKASNLLMKSGVTNIENVPASMRGWRDAGYPVER